MAPTIHFVRHAQGFHNLSVANQSIHDPLLTPYGEQQCKLLSKSFPYTSEVDLIVASPMKRTIYTALLSFPEWKKPIIALPEIQETSDEPCDTGSDKREIEREFSGRNVDLKLVADDWNSKKGRWAPEKAKIEERARAAREWLLARPEKHIVVVSHGGVLHYLTNDWVGMEHGASMQFYLPRSVQRTAEHYYQVMGTGWANTEFRSYVFDQTSGTHAKLVETEESRTRRRGQEKPLSEAEQRNLQRAHEKKSDKDGNVEVLKIAAKV